ncbi:MAG: hypothetical protein C4303_09910, partial [candidate division GAL15 bacterium]
PAVCELRAGFRGGAPGGAGAIAGRPGVAGGAVTRRVRILLGIHLGLVVLLVSWVAYWQVVRGPELAVHPGNPRLLLAEERIQRGRVLDRKARVLAYSVRRDGRTLRVYPGGEVFSHPVGYRSLLLGKAGLEATWDAELLGVFERRAWEQLRRRGGRPPVGLDVVTTLDAELQRASWEALGPRPGAVVVVELRTGQVLASVSRPGFDPNRLEQRWAELRWAPGSPLVDRASSKVYPPGRTFGIVVLSAALSRGLVGLDSPVGCGNAAAVPAHLVREVLTAGCTQGLVRLGEALGGRILREMAEAFGLGQPPTGDVPAAAGQLPEVGDQLRDDLTHVVAGGGRVLASPLQMAAVAATLGRGGERVELRFVQRVQHAEGRALERTFQRAPVRILAVEVAQAVVEAMRASGGGLLAGVRGTVRVGPAPVGWFVALTPTDLPRLALAVVVEGAGEEVAWAVAGKVAQATLRVVP